MRQFITGINIGSTSPGGKLNLGGNLSASAWGASGINVRLEAATFTDTSTVAAGTVTNAMFNSIAIPIFDATNGSAGNQITATNAATLYIEGPPAITTDKTLITNPWSLFIALTIIK